MRKVVSAVLSFAVFASSFFQVALAETAEPELKTVSTVSDSVYEAVYRAGVPGKIPLSPLPALQIAADGEIINLRTSNSKHFRQADGSITAVISLEDVHYEDQYGNFQEINTQLVDESEFGALQLPISKEVAKDHEAISKLNRQMKIDTAHSGFRTLQTPFDASVPKHFDKGYSIGKGDNKLSFIPVGANPARGELLPENHAIVYRNVWPSTDVKLTVKAAGIKEDLILKDEGAPRIFSFKVEGTLADNWSSGELQILPAYLIDAQGVQRDVVQEIRRNGSETFIDLKPNTDGLSYPIIVDPTVTATVWYDVAMVVEGNGRENTKIITHSGNIDLGTYTHSNGSRENYHGLLKWNLNLPQGPSVKVSSASVIIGGAGTTVGTNIPRVRAEMIMGSWSPNTVTYNNKPLISNLVFGSTIELRYSIYTWDVTNIAQQWAWGVPNHGIYFHSNIDNYYYTPNANYKFTFCTTNPYDALEACSVDTATLQINYLLIPTPPTVTSPNGGEIVDALKTITWNASTDMDTVQSSIRYEISLSTNGGSSWTTIVPLTSPGATTTNYDFSSIAPTTTALIRVRGYDGTNYGEYDQSNAYFTIQHNTAPNAPTNPAPGGTTAAAPTITGIAPALNWTFSDPNAGDYQSAYQVYIYNSAGTAVVHDSGWINSALGSYTVPANVLTRGTTYLWNVRTKDSKGASSAASAARYIKPNQLPTAAITSYSNGQQVPDNILHLTWTYSDPNAQAQTKFQVVGSKDNWATWAYNSGEMSSAAPSFTTPALSQGTWSLAVRVFDGLEWSDWAYRNGLVLPNSYEPNDSSANAFPAAYGQQYGSYLSSGTDVDFFKFTANHTGIDKITLQVPAGKNYDVHIYDANMNLLSAGIRGIGLQEEEYILVQTGQTYYAKISGVNGDYSTSATYTFSVNPLEMNYQTNYQFDNNGNLQNKTTTGN